jgi:hypothetical protein
MSRTPSLSAVAPLPPIAPQLRPSAATASRLLFAQDSTIIVCHTEAHQIGTRFCGHSHEVLLLAVENSSNTGNSFVVSYDSSYKAIVWDLFSRIEVGSYQFGESLTALSWVGNGNVVFGGVSRTDRLVPNLTSVLYAGTAGGKIFLFDPRVGGIVTFNSTHRGTITALAPTTNDGKLAIG